MNTLNLGGHPNPANEDYLKTGHGRELFFQTHDQRVMAVSYTAKGDSFAPGKPRVWTETRLRSIGLHSSNYDIAPDGKRLAAFLADDAYPGKPPTQTN